MRRGPSRSIRVGEVVWCDHKRYVHEGRGLRVHYSVNLLPCPAYGNTDRLSLLVGWRGVAQSTCRYPQRRSQHPVGSAQIGRMLSAVGGPFPMGPDPATSAAPLATPLMFSAPIEVAWRASLQSWRAKLALNHCELSSPSTMAS